MISASFRRCRLTAIWAVFFITPAQAEWIDPVTAASETMPKAERSLLLDAVKLDSGHIVAVGERGHVLLSEDGATWRQAAMPSRSTLTAVAASGSDVVAVGHDGVIVRSSDSGETWQRVREEPYSVDNVASESNGSPLLDVLFLDDRRVLAVGAYSLMLTSDDKGATWSSAPITLHAADAGNGAEGPSANEPPADEEAMSDPLLFSDDELMLDDEIDPHLNAAIRMGSTGLLLAGERGMVFRSDDDGVSWRRLDLPYGGSMYGALVLGEAHLLVYGLRGRAFESQDAGTTWREVETRTQATLFDGRVGDDGAIVLVGAQGVVVRRPAGDAAFNASVYETETGETPTTSAVLAHGSGELLLFGDRGVFVWRQP